MPRLIYGRGMPHFTKLLVWEKAHGLMVQTHHVAKTIRHADDRALRAQMNRAAESIAANIVEGRGKSSDAEFARFLKISLGSAYELEYHAMAARDVQAITEADCAHLISLDVEVRRMLCGLIRRLTTEHD